MPTTAKGTAAAGMTIVIVPGVEAVPMSRFANHLPAIRPIAHQIARPIAAAFDTFNDREKPK
jgi:hypothetical protein